MATGGTSFTTLHWLVAAAVAFAAGSIPFGPIVARAHGVDLRTVGSGNIGATNVGRALGRGWGILVYVLDAAKGAIPVLLAGSMANILGKQPEAMAPGELWGWLTLPVAAVLGHMFSPWMGFKGGKGVATGSGAMLAVWPVLTGPVVVAIGLWALVLAVTRMVSVASVVAAIAIPMTVAFSSISRTGDGTPDGSMPLEHAVPAIVVTGAVAALVVWKHRGNMQRVLAGTESKVGKKTG
jgi:glycerol-3-phosphate acyltransferase PlsY